MLDLTHARFEDHPANPLIAPTRPGWLIADPTLLPPDSTPDGQWHLFANSVGRIHHYQSPDGIAWSRIQILSLRAIRPFIYTEASRYYLFFERFIRPWRSGIAVCCSTDLQNWDKPRLLLEAQGPHDGHGLCFAGNPCLIKTANEYRLYLSYHWVFLRDCLYFEPCDREPIVAPEPGWKRAFVYAFHPVAYNDEVRLYYNARDGWFRGVERIGLAVARGPMCLL